MSYTLAYTGTQIDNILGRSAPSGEFDGYFADINDKLDKLNIVTTSDDYATVQAYVQNNVAVALSDGGGFYAYAGEHDGNYYFAKLTQGSSDTTDAVYEVAYIDSGDNWSVGNGSALAPVFSPNFTGNPTAPTPIQSSNNTRIATTAFVHSAVDPVSSAALNAYPTDTASGDVVSITDGADGIPVKEFTGSIVPQQNLNGQSAPYPAGGGKNKVGKSDGNTGTLTRSGVTFKFEDDGSVTLSGTATAAIYPCLFDSTGATIASNSNWHGSSSRMPLTSGTYKFTATITGTGLTASSVTLAAYDGETQRLINGAAAANTIDGVNSVFLSIANGTAFSNCNIKWQLESGSTATAYAQYANVCPISGWTGANIYRVGVNLWSETWETGAYDTTTGAPYNSNNQIRVKNAEPITVPPSTEINFSMTGSAGRISNIFWYDEDDNFISYYANASAATFQQTSPANARYLRFQCAVAYGATYKNDITVNISNASINGNYYPYNGSTIVLSFGQTVYAGTLTALGGGLWSVQPTHALVPNPESLTYYKYTSWGSDHTFSVDIPNIKPNSTIVCSKYGQKTQAEVLGGTATGWYYRSDIDDLYISDPTYTTAAAFKASMAGVQILFPLATLPDPITITGEDLQTLLGANTVWTDCGSVTGMTYRADTALYIDKKLGA